MDYTTALADGDDQRDFPQAVLKAAPTTPCIPAFFFAAPVGSDIGGPDLKLTGVRIAGTRFVYNGQANYNPVRTRLIALYRDETRQEAEDRVNRLRNELWQAEADLAKVSAL